MGPYLPFLAISLGGVLGANARYLVSVYVAERLGTAFPYGTLLINVSGSLVIGFFLTLATERFTVDPLWRLFFATGFLGAYTTFSSYTFEAAQLVRDGAYGLAFLYLFGSVLAGMIGVFAGIVAERSTTVLAEAALTPWMSAVRSRGYKAPIVPAGRTRLMTMAHVEGGPYGGRSRASTRRRRIGSVAAGRRSVRRAGRRSGEGGASGTLACRSRRQAERSGPGASRPGAVQLAGVPLPVRRHDADDDRQLHAEVAQGWLIYDLTGSPTWLGIVSFARGIPMLVLALPAGVLVDRFDRRKVLITAQGLTALVAVVLAALIATGLVQPWHVAADRVPGAAACSC